MYIFFFSSRRRHTRFDCDWSSDVCSSDLGSPGRRRGPPGRRAPATPPLPVAAGPPPGEVVPEARVAALLEGGRGLLRSEEHTSELQSQSNLVCRLLLEKKKK